MDRPAVAAAAAHWFAKISKKIKSSSTAVEPDDDSDGDGADGGESIEEGTAATDKLDAMDAGDLKVVLGAMGFSEKGTRKVLLSRLHNKIDKGTHPARPAHPQPVAPSHWHVCAQVR